MLPEHNTPAPADQIAFAGRRFGMLTVVEKSTVKATSGFLWLCRCDCGNAKLARRGDLLRGDYQSCGCHRTANSGGVFRTKRPEYKVWADMLVRCRCPRNPRFKDYGGRGITVCDGWQTFENFFADMGPRPKGAQLDRIDNDGDYNADNCRWVSAKTNARNRRTARILAFSGRAKSLVEWAEELGIRTSAIHSRLRLGWTVEEALSTPIRRGQKLHSLREGR